jgi:hypothetical protein
LQYSVRHRLYIHGAGIFVELSWRRNHIEPLYGREIFLYFCVAHIAPLLLQPRVIRPFPVLIRQPIAAIRRAVNLAEPEDNLPVHFLPPREYASFDVYVCNSNTTSPAANIDAERISILNPAKKTAWDFAAAQNFTEFDA